MEKLLYRYLFDLGSSTFDTSLNYLTTRYRQVNADVNLADKTFQRYCLDSLIGDAECCGAPYRADSSYASSVFCNLAHSRRKSLHKPNRLAGRD